MDFIVGIVGGVLINQLTQSSQIGGTVKEEKQIIKDLVNKNFNARSLPTLIDYNPQTKTYMKW